MIYNLRPNYADEMIGTFLNSFAEIPPERFPKKVNQQSHEIAQFLQPFSSCFHRNKTKKEKERKSV